MPLPLRLSGIPFLITTTRRPSLAQTKTARRLAAEWDQPYIERQAGALPNLLQQAGPALYHGILVVRKGDYVFWRPDGPELFYHPDRKSVV